MNDIKGPTWKDIAAIVAFLALVAGVMMIVASESEQRHADVLEAREAWIGHAVYAYIDGGLFGETYIVEGSVLGWKGEVAMVKESSTNKIHLVYLSHLEGR